MQERAKKHLKIIFNDYFEYPCFVWMNTDNSSRYPENIKSNRGASEFLPEILRNFITFVGVSKSHRWFWDIQGTDQGVIGGLNGDFMRVSRRFR